MVDFQEQIVEQVVALIQGRRRYHLDYGVVESEFNVGATSIHVCFEYDNTGVWLTEVDYSDYETITALNETEKTYLTHQINGELHHQTVK
jgi:hypothetical protein